MSQKLKNTKLILIGLALLLLTASFVSAQENPVKLRKGVAVKGVVGGDGHQSYAVRNLRRGQILTITIERRVPRDGNFNLTVSRGATFADGQSVNFGKETSGRQQLVWTGKIPRDGSYYIYLTGFNPSGSFQIKYTLRATWK
jgi:hypothetical protein